jgi:hypothetical protein
MPSEVRAGMERWCGARAGVELSHAPLADLVSLRPRPIVLVGTYGKQSQAMAKRCISALPATYVPRFAIMTMIIYGSDAALGFRRSSSSLSLPPDTARGYPPVVAQGTTKELLNVSSRFG